MQVGQHQTNKSDGDENIWFCSSLNKRKEESNASIYQDMSLLNVTGKRDDEISLETAKNFLHQTTTKVVIVAQFTEQTFRTAYT